ncbi:MAG: phage tail protein [Catonella sp.]|uniref:phage tail protein n=1 Tax=Catonella sp. TaxID=2382125 RepID=UPI003F9F9480
MAKIGNLGKLITFQVSSKKVLTFNDMERKVSGRWVVHDVIKGKPKSEFLGAGLQEVSLSVLLLSTMGVKPRKTLERIRKATERGERFTFVIGGKPISKNKWVITETSETWDVIFSKGELVQARIELNLREYR